MPGLSFGLNVGLTGLQSAQSALNVIGHNIANVNTPGYSRQRAGLTTNPNQLFGGVYFGAGTNLSNVESIRDRYLDLQILQTISQNTGTNDRFQTIQGISTTFESTGDASLSAMIQKFFQGFQDLAARPEDAALRTNVVGRAQIMVNGLKERYQALADQRRQADSALVSTVAEVNGLVSQIAALNSRIVTESPVSADNDARDQRKALTDKLAGLIGITAFEASDGSLTVLLDSGVAPLVTGGTSYQLSTTPDPLNNNYATLQVDLGGTFLNVTQQVSGGMIGSKLDLRDNILAGFMRQMDQLAAGIQGAVNLQHRAGYALDGITWGLDFFQGGVANGANGLPPSVSSATFYAGMINSLTVNAAVAGNPSLIAAAGVAGAAGDNANARALANLQSATSTVDTNGDGVADSGPFSTVVGSLINSIGTEASTLESSASTQDNLLTALQTHRDRISAVDLDEEASQLMAFQRAYQASARFLSVIDQLTDQLVNQFGR
jgi:flagellar hook-associated protein 1 FlgK